MTIGRISTAGLFAQGMASMLARQSSLAHIQRQIATGNRLLNAKDDPVAAGIAVSLDRGLAELEQYGKNADALQHRLSLEESALTAVGDHLARVHELTIEANNSALTSEGRKAIATEIRYHRDALVGLANSTDGSGRFLFGGAHDQSVPFALGSSVSYGGDQIQRLVEVAPEVRVHDADPGSEVFLRVPTGTAGISARPDVANTGTGVLASCSFVDASLWDKGQYTITFNAGNYEVRDAANALVTTGAYQTGIAIEFRGIQFTLTGMPANGDRFDVGTAAPCDIFTTLDNLATALEAADLTSAQHAAQQNAFYASIEDLNAAQNHFAGKRAGVGVRLATLEQSIDSRAAQKLAVQTRLSSLRDVDYAEAASRLRLEMTALEAAQQSFLRVQSLSLFDLLR